MFCTQYQISNGKKIELVLDDKRKKPGLYVSTGDAWQKVASFDNDEGLALFLDAFSMARPEWFGKTYQEMMTKKFPFTRKD